MAFLSHSVGIFLLLTAVAADVPVFSKAHAQGRIDHVDLDDASGLAASRKFPGILYAHNDHGDRPRLFAINESNAHVVAVLEISPAYNYDWEDIAVGPCTKEYSRSCIYISDDGEYNHADERTIYRVVEPDIMQHQTLAPDAVLKFNWTEHGSKTLLVDPEANVFVISAMLGGRGMIVNLPILSWGQPNPVFVESGDYVGIESDTTDPNAGDISPDGNEVILKTMDDVYYWSVPDHDYMSALTHRGQLLGNYSDHNGQGLCFSADGQAFYTLAEGSHKTLYKYTRL